MRPLPVLVLLLAPIVAGCLAPDELQGAAATPLDPASIVAPAGARVEAIEGGARILWESLPLPFREEFTLPQGTTLVRLTAEGAAGDAFGVGLRNAESNRRRCQMPAVVSWNEGILGRNACVALTAVDDLPATWVASVSGAATAKLIAIDLLTGPVEGPAAQLDLAQLSKPTLGMRETEVVKVESFDGTMLHVEVTRPDTAEKVPTVLVSSPYNDATRKAGMRPSDDLVLDWGPRGYALVVADVRGYGDSEGCVEVWSEAEQRDQVALVEWVAAQEWSDGNVGFYGQSYVATTPVAAAVNAPDALKAIIAVAPVINAYDDWHFGGVPNGEDALSPVGYQQIGGGLESAPLGSTSPEDYAAFLQDVPRVAQRADNGFCDPTLVARANDPRALYDAFYEERNFSARAKDVKAAVLYTQGFEDSNVKSAMITHWFNALESPKLGLFGHWVHQHPLRADQETLFLAWMDQHVKGKPLGLERLAAAHVVTNQFTVREDDAWPPLDATEVRYYPDFAGRALAPAPVDGYQLLQIVPAPLSAPLPGRTTLVSLAGPVAERTHLAGSARVDVSAHMEAGENGYVAAFLYDDDRLVTWGMFNIAHREGHDRHASANPGDMLAFSIPLLPTEHVFEPGHEIRLEIRAAHVKDWALVKPTQPSAIGLHGGPDGLALVLPTVPADRATPAPASLNWS